jgi:hypothetical protein
MFQSISKNFKEMGDWLGTTHKARKKATQMLPTKKKVMTIQAENSSWASSGKNVLHK